MVSKKIELTVIVFDLNKVPRPKKVFYDMEMLRGKNIRDWDNNGVVDQTKSVLFTSMRPSNKDDDYVVIGMSKDDLVKKLTDAGIIEIHS